MRIRLFGVVLLVVLFVSGCASYARNVALIYEPVLSVRGGSGDLYIAIPADQQLSAGSVKWVLGDVKNDDGNKIDEIYSPLSPAQLLQNALSQELKRAGYAVIPTTVRAAAPVKEVFLSRSEVTVDQDESSVGLKATCRIVMTLEVSKGGQLLKKVTYETRYSDTNIKDRDLLAKSILQETLQAVMRKAVPELIATLEQ
ncbi:hypothetical protein [Geobacter sp. SVR]|uniref:hypothetical protein n=1 Tax=Geobacter sp. SVR TaxID=2495594 RepID=UPI00143EF787|nr:hypothetical protein [Geobacter sp. SVR]BCS52714.1 hypothetical protein GSVR_10220 [Geobacter sp. SVR]GCF86790.1 lipoprotein [Geobacter sp. SVR]